MALKDYLTKTRFVPFVVGSLMSANFLLIWALPVMGMGLLYKTFFAWALQPLYRYLEGHAVTKYVAKEFLYTNPRHSDYLVLSVVVLVKCVCVLGWVLYMQLRDGSLPWYVVALYYCHWVGLGGTTMGTVYAVSHKEGHAPNFYKKPVAQVIGNIYENGLGMFFGNVPFNFTTSHVKIHHATNGGAGDTFYLWDLDRGSMGDFMLYVHRILLHMTGVSSVLYFEANDMHDRAVKLKSGIQRYFLTAAIILIITRSPSFLFWIYLQPVICMTYFLALINIGFHGFLDFDEKGRRIACVDSTAIVNGNDDFWGEDDHMAHHYNTNVYYRDLPALHDQKLEEWKKHHASVFHTISIMELSIFILLGIHEELVKNYVDYSGKLDKETMIRMFKERIARKETDYETYIQYLNNPTKQNRDMLRIKITNSTDADGDISANQGSESKKSS